MKKPNIAKIATLNADGSPYVNPIWYEYDGVYFYLGARARSQAVKNILRDGRVCLCIDEPTQPHTRVVIQGTAEVTALAEEMNLAIGTKY